MSYLSISELCKSLLWAPVDHESGERADVYCATDTDLDIAESRLGVDLPQDYRWFMKHYGMRGLEDPRVNVGLNGISLSFLGMFAAIDTAVTLTHQYARPNPHGRAAIPDRSLVIADSIAGDLLLLDLSTRDYGKVRFRHKDLMKQVWTEEPQELTLLANSFTHLLEQIVASPRPKVEHLQLQEF